MDCNSYESNLLNWHISDLINRIFSLCIAGNFLSILENHPTSTDVVATFVLAGQL